MADNIKILHTGDTHTDNRTHGTINPATGQNTAEESHLRVLSNAVQKAIDENVQLFVHAGDAFAHGIPRPSAVIAHARALEPLTHTGIPLVLIGGNHELLRISSSEDTANQMLFEILSQKGEVYFCESDAELIRTSNGIQIIANPWMSKARILPKLGHNPKDIDALEADKLLADHATNELERLSALADATAPLIYAAHVTLDDVRIDNLAKGATRGSEMDMAAHVFNEPIQLSQPIDDSDVSYGAVSHIHDGQRIGLKSFYAGSPDAFTMTDADKKKYVNIATISADNKLISVDHHDVGARIITRIALADDDAEARIDALEKDTLVGIKLPAGELDVPKTVTDKIREAGARIVDISKPRPERKKNTKAFLPEKIDPVKALEMWMDETKPERIDPGYAKKLAEEMIQFSE